MALPATGEPDPPAVHGHSELLKLLVGSEQIWVECGSDEHLPCRLEIGAGLVEGRGGAIGALAGMTAGIEAARPAPRILVPGNAGANRGLPVANHHSAASFTKPKKRPPRSGVLAPFNHPFG